MRRWYHGTLTRLCRGLRGLARWVLATVHPPEDEIDAAVRAAFADVGLNVELYAADCPLRDKRYEVLHFAGQRLGYAFETVDDIKALLR